MEGSADHRSLQVVDLRAEYQTNPLGLDVAKPRLSWRLQSDARAALQSCYQVRVASSEQALRAGTGLVWDSGRVSTDESIQIVYAGPSLRSRQRYYWQVQVWTRSGAASGWSAPAWWEMGLGQTEEWKAHWIRPAVSSDVVPLLRRSFAVRANATRARVYVTSRGLYQLFLNGRRVGDVELAPGWTSYDNQLLYQTYDISALIKTGDNVAGALLGEGWYSGLHGIGGSTNLRRRYGERTALLAQIEIEYADGTTDCIVTDGQWRTSLSPVLASGIYAGETYDARLEQPGWNRPGFDDSRWDAAEVTAESKDMLVAQSGPPMRQIEQLTPQRIWRTPDGHMVADMGQNMVGWVRLRVQGPAGTVVTLRHVEVLDRDGGLYTDNLRGAAQLVTYTLKGEGAEVYEPHFTFQGFRYVAVDGYPGELTPEQLTGVVVHSDIGRSGDFETSSPLLNQLHHNIVWGQKGNFLDVPTDCPQRDERAGWTGDAQVFAPTAAFNADVLRFFAKWLRDLAAEQAADGSVPWVVPDVLRQREGEIAVLFAKDMPTPVELDKIAAQDHAGAAGWGDAATIIPWTLYLAYGDRRILEEQYDSMVHWIDYQRRRSGEDLLWARDFQFGDWLDFGSGDRKRFGATHPDLIATAYFAQSVHLVSRAAEVLGKADDAARYAKLFSGIRAAFQRAFVRDGAVVGEGTQTAYVLALQFGLLAEDQRPEAARRLAENVRAQGHLTTGFLGTPGLLFALSDHGYLKEAYQLLNRQEYPSWLYAVGKGATTIWERWDGIKPDGSFQDPMMNSFNHYAYGAVGEWMYRVIGGINIDPASPGYKHTVIKPRPGGGLTHAKTSHLSRYGRVLCAWRIDGARFQLSIEIPANTTATVCLPLARQAEVLEGGKDIGLTAGVSNVRQSGADVMVDVGSGIFEFSYPRRSAEN